MDNSFVNHFWRRFGLVIKFDASASEGHVYESHTVEHLCTYMCIFCNDLGIFFMYNTQTLISIFKKK